MINGMGNNVANSQDLLAIMIEYIVLWQKVDLQGTR
jgi:hypothetical protein